MAYPFCCRLLINIPKNSSLLFNSCDKSLKLARCLYNFGGSKTDTHSKCICDFGPSPFRERCAWGQLGYFQIPRLYPSPVHLYSIYLKCTSSSPKLLFQGIPHRRSNREEGFNIIGRGNGNSKLRATKQKFRETKRKVKQRIGEIKENVLTIPNGLCLLRIGATPVLGYLVLNGSYTASLVIFLLAGITDMLDGYIARNFPNQQSMIGSFLDPAADKLLIATLFITLTAAGLIPVPLTSLIIARDACLMGAGLYIRYMSLPPPRTVSRYFDVTFATAKLSPTFLSKANTGIQLSLVALSLAAPVFDFVNHPHLQALWYVTASTTILSWTSYLFSKDTYRILSGSKSRRK